MNPPAPHLVLVGPMGAGKSTIGPLLAERLGLPFADLDQDIAAAAGIGIPALFEREGEAGFRERERAALAARLEGAPGVLATGGGAVLDPESRRLLRAHACVAWLRCSPATQLQRLADCTDRPLLQRPDRGAVLQRLATEREPLYAEVADLVFDTDGRGAGEAAAELAARILRAGAPA